MRELGPTKALSATVGQVGSVGVGASPRADYAPGTDRLGMSEHPSSGRRNPEGSRGSSGSDSAEVGKAV